MKCCREPWAKSFSPQILFGSVGEASIDNDPVRAIAVESVALLLLGPIPRGLKEFSHKDLPASFGYDIEPLNVTDSILFKTSQVSANRKFRKAHNSVDAVCHENSR